MKYLYRDNYRKIYKCDFSDLPKILYSEINRKVDEKRVLEIVESFPSGAKILPSPWIEAYERNGKYFITDGQHRISALKILSNTVKNIVFYISVCTNLVDPKKEFIRINKNVNVSDLYLESEDHRQKLYEEVVDYYYKKYKVFFKTSSTPQKPHMNKDVFLQILYESDTSFTFDDIIKSFSNLSDQHKRLKDVPENTDPKLKKCRQFNFYLFFSEPFELKNALM